MAIGGSGKGIQIVVGADYNDRDLKRAQRDLDQLKRQAALTQSPMQKLGATLKGAIGPAFAMAGAAAGAFAVKLAVDGVQAAIEEQKQLAILKQTLDNVGQSFAMPQVNQFIDDLRFATGVTDDELRPAFQKLVGATKDAAAAQDLLAASVDASVGSGKSLESVSAAVSKAVAGSSTSLRKLIPELDATALAGGGVDKVLEALTKRFGGSAAAAADTLAGQMARVKDGFDELLESFGAGFISAFDQAEGQVNTLAQALRDAQPDMESAGRSLGLVAESVLSLSDKLEPIISYYATAIQLNIGIVNMWGDAISAILNPSEALNTATQEIGDSATGTAAAIENDMVVAAKRLYQQSHATNDELRRQYFTLDEVASGAGRYTDAMTLLRADMRRTIVRLGFLAAAFDDANAAMDRRDAMRSYRESLKTFIEEPTAEARDAAVTDMMAVAESFDDPTKRAKFTASAVGTIIKAARDAGVAVPSDLANIGSAARNQMDPIASLKQAMEEIDGTITSTIIVDFKWPDGRPPGGWPKEWYGAKGGEVPNYYASGGAARGQDTVPAMLAPGEFVIRRAAVKQFGSDLFSQLNRGINPLAGMGPVSGPRSGGFQIGTINVVAAPGERAETSVPRALRRQAFLAGVNG